MDRTGLVNSNLAALRERAKGFDEAERAVILAEMPVDELMKAAQTKCAELTSKIERIEAFIRKCEA